MDKALLVIDYTYDFVAEDGLLTCGKAGLAIDLEISSLIKKFASDEQYIVVVNDTHRENDPYHPESQLFPPHNIANSKGRELYGQVRKTVESTVSEKGSASIYFIDKTRYSAFAGTDLEIRLRERKINKIYLAGVCTDICILHTAIDAYNKGFDVFIPKNAVASFNPVGHEWALAHFTNVLGAQVLV